jgi:hypothetical protein
LSSSSSSSCLPLLPYPQPLATPPSRHADPRARAANRIHR